MRTRPLILIADDTPANLDILRTRLESQSYDVVTACDGEEAIEGVRAHLPDLILLDVMMPKLNGLEVCRILKADASLPFMPIILVTAKSDSRDIVEGLKSGGDEYVTKPLDQAALSARVGSLLRIKALHDTVREQSAKLESQAAELAEWNRALESRVAEQMAELERTNRLRRFLSPQLAELVVSSGEARVLESHRSDVAVVFCDLRGFTTLAETAEPEEVMHVLKDYHTALGAIIHHFEGTLERFLGDGMMVLFNDPLPCADAAARAVCMAVAMRTRMNDLEQHWLTRGRHLGFGVGIAQGYATLGQIGFEGRYDYAAIGTVANIAARLCAEAKPGQILVSRRVMSAVKGFTVFRDLGDLALKGLSQPVRTYDVVEIANVGSNSSTATEKAP